MNIQFLTYIPIWKPKKTTLKVTSPGIGGLGPAMTLQETPGAELALRTPSSTTTTH